MTDGLAAQHLRDLINGPTDGTLKSAITDFVNGKRRANDNFKEKRMEEQARSPFDTLYGGLLLNAPSTSPSGTASSVAT